MSRTSHKLPTLRAAWTLDDLPDGERFWQRVEATLRRHLGEPGAAAGRAAAAAIEEYVLAAQAEANAVPLARAEARVAELRRTAAAFWQALWRERRDGATEAESLIEQMSDHRPDLALRALGKLAGDFVSACDRAQEELAALARGKHGAPGAAWTQFIAALADLFEAATATPATASKDRTAAQPSRFVRFAHAMQSLLPWTFWRHPRATKNSRRAAEPSAAFTLAVAKALAARRRASAADDGGRLLGARAPSPREAGRGSG